MTRDRKYYTDANRESWDEAADRHRAANQARLLQDVRNTDYNALDHFLIEALAVPGVAGKSVVQLCCNNAKDLLSVMRMGAARGVGVDASTAFIAQGEELVAAADLQDRMELIVSDVYELPDRLTGQFDIVLITVGVFGWMPDLPLFYRVIERLLKPGGYFVIEDMHPVLMMYEPGKNGAPSTLQWSYFKQDPWRDTEGLDYFEHKDYEGKPAYSFMFKLDDILMGGLGVGLALRHFKEIDVDISHFCQDLEHVDSKPPLGFTMVMEKPAQPIGGTE